MTRPTLVRTASASRAPSSLTASGAVLTLAAAAATLALAAAAFASVAPPTVSAAAAPPLVPLPPAPVAALSSHREAPFITETPKVDGTDFYMFTSYEPEQSGFVTFIANYLPLQPSYGGPNFFTLDPEAVYDIHVDNDGDAAEDLTFRFRFQNNLQDLSLQVGEPGSEKTVAVPLVNIGAVTAADDSAQNVLETFTLEVLEHTGKKIKTTAVTNAAGGAAVFDKPLDNIGSKSIADYGAYAAAHVYDITLPGGSAGRAFVGQRADPFVVNLGDTFDLVNTDPLGPEDGEANTLADDNVTSLILEIPKSFLLSDEPDASPVIGGWTTASLPVSRKLQTEPSFEEPAKEKGKLRQVSRLGSPLVNELVIGIRDKDLFNASEPKDDSQFLDYVTNPTLPELLQILFGVTAPNLFPRSDLVQAFLTGIPALNENGSVGEMLRLNTETAPVLPAAQNRLGVIGGDSAGFPNGRRPGDDVVDIALRVVMGALLTPDVAPDGDQPFTDGAIVDATVFGSTFPYLNTPTPGSP